MPKMKTSRTAAKRMRISGSGRVRRGKAGGNHMLRGKSARRLRRLRKNDMIDPVDAKRFKRLLPYGY